MLDALKQSSTILISQYEVFKKNIFKNLPQQKLQNHIEIGTVTIHYPLVLTTWAPTSAPPGRSL